MASHFDSMADCSFNTHGFTEDEGTFTEEERELIGREASRLKREFEAERMKRKANYASQRNQSASLVSYEPDPVQHETLRSMNALREADRELGELQMKKLSATKELKSLQESTKKARNELRLVEKSVKDTHTKHDDDKSEIAMLEFKKEQARRELREIEERIGSRKKMYDNQLDLNTAEILSVIEERDSLKRRIANGEGALGYIERLEVERQLNTAKDELFAEQRSSRMRIEALHEELDEALRRIDEFDTANQDLITKITVLESENKNKLENSIGVQDLLRTELRECKNQLEDRKVVEHRLELDISEKEKAIREYQALLLEKEREISTEHEIRSRTIAEKNFELASTKEAKESALICLKEQLEAEKRAAQEEISEKYEKERRELVTRHEDKIADMRSELSREVDSKNQELSYYREKLRQQEDATRELGERLRIEAQEQVRSAVSREKNLWEDEQQRLMKRERSNWEDEVKRTSTRLNEAIQYEKVQYESLQKTANNLRREVEELRSQNKELHKEATQAHITAKEAVYNDHQRELSNLRENASQDKNTEVTKLQQHINSIEEDLTNTRKELSIANEKIKQMEHTYEHHCKAIILEINDECRKLSQIIGIAPRKVNIERYDRKSRSLNTSSSPQRSPTTDALANLRACISELIPYVSNLRDNIEGYKYKVLSIKEDKEDELKSMREHYVIEKEKEVELAKEKLATLHLSEVQQLQDAINRDTDMETALRQSIRDRDNEIRELKTNMQIWKEETAGKLTKQFEKEVEVNVQKKLREDGAISRTDFIEQQKMIIRLEDQISRLKAEQALSKPSVGGNPDSSSVKLLRHLQERVRHLKNENLRLRSGGADFDVGSSAY